MTQWFNITYKQVTEDMAECKLQTAHTMHHALLFHAAPHRA